MNRGRGAKTASPCLFSIGIVYAEKSRSRIAFSGLIITLRLLMILFMRYSRSSSVCVRRSVLVPSFVPWDDPEQPGDLGDRTA
jgi:hypothetical protein